MLTWARLLSVPRRRVKSVATAEVSFIVLFIFSREVLVYTIRPLLEYLRPARSRYRCPGKKRMRPDQRLPERVRNSPKNLDAGPRQAWDARRPASCVR